MDIVGGGSTRRTLGCGSETLRAARTVETGGWYREGCLLRLELAHFSLPESLVLGQLHSCESSFFLVFTKSSQDCFGAPPKQLPEWLIGFVVEKDDVIKTTW